MLEAELTWKTAEKCWIDKDRFGYLLDNHIKFMVRGAYIVALLTTPDGMEEVTIVSREHHCNSFKQIFNEVNKGGPFVKVFQKVVTIAEELHYGEKYQSPPNGLLAKLKEGEVIQKPPSGTAEVVKKTTKKPKVFKSKKVPPVSVKGDLFLDGVPVGKMPFVGVDMSGVMEKLTPLTTSEYNDIASATGTASPSSDEEAVVKEYLPYSTRKLRDPIPLYLATELLHPVKGSDPTSRYFYIGTSKCGTNLAIRLRDGKLSVRIERNDNDGQKMIDDLKASSLKVFTFSMYIANGGERKYGSVHLNCPTQGMYMAAVGALLASLMVKTSYPLNELLIIAKEGV